MHERKYVCSIMDFDERFVVELIGIIRRRVKGCGVERFAESITTQGRCPTKGSRTVSTLAILDINAFSLSMFRDGFFFFFFYGTCTDANYTLQVRN